MKYLKMLGLAALAVASMAFIGVGSASATELCSTTTNPCTSPYGVGTVIAGSSTNATLTSSLGNVVCSGSSMEGKTTSQGSSKTNVEGTIEKVSFSGCTLTTPFGGGIHNCSVTPINTPWKAVVATEITGVVNDNGLMTVSSDGNGEPGAKVDCGASVLRCQFTASSIVLNVNGGTSPTVVAKEEPLNRAVYEGGLCPSTSTWDANYSITKPTPLYVI